MNVGGSRCECGGEQPMRMWGAADVNVEGSRCERGGKPM